MHTMFGGSATDSSIDPDDEEIKKICTRAENASTIVAASYNGHVKRGQLKLLCALADMNKPMIAVALRNPYDLGCLADAFARKEVRGIAAYEYSTSALSCVADILRGSAMPTGRLNMSIAESLSR